MKEYKVGDTVYMKGKVKKVDNTTLPYYVDFGNGNIGWINSDNIIDELPTAEPVKPVLPKYVGEELDIAKNELQISFDVYIGNIINRVSSAKASYHYYIFNINAIIKLANAWNNGYTVEPEKKYNLVLGTDTDDGTNALFKYESCTDDALGLNTDTYADDLKLDELYQFTQSEIDKYNNDFWIKNIDLNDYKIEVTDDDAK